MELDDAERSAILEDLAGAQTGFGIEGPGIEAHRRSPTCGDDMTVRVGVVDGTIRTLRWQGHGCVVSRAAASALAAVAPGITTTEFTSLAAAYLASLEPDAAPVPSPADRSLEDLDVFAGIGRFPLRAGCASLAWRATLDALEPRDIPRA
ncbi:SUF system NifU family Fe-S cluster assembly protein [soil metagenome]